MIVTEYYDKSYMSVFSFSKYLTVLDWPPYDDSDDVSHAYLGNEMNEVNDTGTVTQLQATTRVTWTQALLYQHSWSDD